MKTMDVFFTQKNCDRCGEALVARTMSWFNEQCICMECGSKEDELRNKLPLKGRAYEGCGYIPEVK
jgi:hypothetical protein